MNFKPIDFNAYSKPPYYPQYLSRGEAKKLVKFDDEQFEELDLLIDETSDQYDLEKAKGILLDRLGKLVDENRDGNNDEIYRILIRLRTILNTTSCSINDIIRVIKFIFSSEVVRIQPNYPAGLTILHDGESPTIDFNKYISQVVAAGVAYDTKELFFFTEKIDVTETSIIVVKREVAESFFGQIKHNARIARDGHTVRNIEGNTFHHDGRISRDGTAQHKLFWTPANSTIYPPFRHCSGAQDRLDIAIKKHFAEQYRGAILHNRAFQHNGVIKHGVNPYPASDAMSDISFRLNMADIVPETKDRLDVHATEYHAEDLNKSIRHDRKFRRNREHIHFNFPLDRLTMRVSIEAQSDRYFGSLFRNKSFTHNGTERHCGAGTQTAYESFFVGIRYHNLHNRKYRHNGAIRHNGNVLIPLE